MFIAFMGKQATAQPECTKGSVLAFAGRQSLTIGDATSSLPIYGLQTTVNGSCDQSWLGLLEFGVQIDVSSATGRLADQKVRVSQFAAGPKICLRFATNTGFCGSFGASELNLHAGENYRLGAFQQDISLEQRVFGKFAVSAGARKERYTTGGTAAQNAETSAYVLGFGWAPAE